ncbi:hypothetical protein AT959_03675 [Dechloromonas denitrificans]|uniref:Uncharacterized protein n=1 Tax=Dechloromonas denitrificans TaxID=281362 RepID=A0A133XMJ8_9RHOO|nr:hypothetical protein AT959_03675 [Dechloromonas denitrificans]
MTASGNIALDRIKGDHCIVLCIATRGCRAFAFFRKCINLHHHHNAQHSDHQANHDFDQAET